MGLRFRRRPQSERGAVAILMAALMIVLLTAAALGVDLASQVNRKHLLINQLDSASTAAAAEFNADGSLADAVAAAQAFFAANGQGELDLEKVDFWCVVARKLNGDMTPFTPAMAAAYQIPTVTFGGGECNPDAVSPATIWAQTEYQNRTRTWPDPDQQFDMNCNSRLCAIPCALTAGPSNGWNPGQLHRETTDLSPATPSGSVPSRTSRSASLPRSASTMGPRDPRSRSPAPVRAAPSPPTRWTSSSSPTARCR